MHWRVWLAIISIAGVACLATGQESAPAEGDPPATGEATPAPNPSVEPAAPSTEPPKTSQGDVIHLKSGRTIQGLQVIRATATEYIVEVLEGATIRIPRRQVLSVEYDTIDPIELRKQQEAAKRQQQTTLVPGIKLTPELQAKLGVDISNPPFHYVNRDVVEIIEELSGRVDGILAVDQSVRDLPPDRRVWSIESQAGQTLESFLREGLLRSFPDLTLVVDANKILITTKGATRATAPDTTSPPGAAVPPATAGNEPPAP